MLLRIVTCRYRIFQNGGGDVLIFVGVIGNEVGRMVSDKFAAIVLHMKTRLGIVEIVRIAEIHRIDTLPV